jgi:YD repeat-containing protein
MVKSAYEYDAFGNRTSLVEDNTKTAYKYDVLDRLVEAKELRYSQAIVKRMIMINEATRQKTFTIDAINMLAKVTDVAKGGIVILAIVIGILVADDFFTLGLGTVDDGAIVPLATMLLNFLSMLFGSGTPCFG